MTRDQAQRIARAIFDDVEMSGLFSLDRVTDVIERTARMERTPPPPIRADYASLVAALDSASPTKVLIGMLARDAARQTIIQPDD